MPQPTWDRGAKWPHGKNVTILYDSRIYGYDETVNLHSVLDTLSWAESGFILNNTRNQMNANNLYNFTYSFPISQSSVDIQNYKNETPDDTVMVYFGSKEATRKSPSDFFTNESASANARAQNVGDSWRAAAKRYDSARNVLKGAVFIKMENIGGTWRVDGGNWQGLIKHEFGHVAGVPHLIAEAVMESKYPALTDYTSIDYDFAGRLPGWDGSLTAWTGDD